MISGEHYTEYYDARNEAQQSNDITSWVTWFVHMVLEAQIQAEEQIDFTLKKARLFDRFRDQLNDRQLKILRRMLEEGPEGFEGGMSAKKYMSITGMSKATATRDLQDLADKGVLVPSDGGRSTHYQIKLWEESVSPTLSPTPWAHDELLALASVPHH